MREFPLLLELIVENVGIVHFDIKAELELLRILHQVCQLVVLLLARLSIRKDVQLCRESVYLRLLFQSMTIQSCLAYLLAVPVKLII